MRKAKAIAEGLAYLIDMVERAGPVNGVGVYTYAEHDVFYAGPDNRDLITPDVIAKMESLGWHKDEDGGFMIYT